MDDISSQISFLLSLPSEIHLIILQFLDVPDILNIRQTCVVLHKATFERGLWLRILNEQANSYPLPLHILCALHGEVPLQEYPTRVIEYMVRNTRRIAAAWPRRRQGPLRLLPRERTDGSLLGLELLVDRWLLVIYCEGAMYLYDLQPSSGNNNQEQANVKPILRTLRVFETSLKWMSYSAAVDPKGDELVVALAHTLEPFPIQIYRVDLGSLASSNLVVTDAFRLEKSLLLPSIRVVRAIDIENHLIVASNLNLVEVTKWDAECCTDETNPKKFVISLHEDSSEQWGEIIAARFMGPYILIFKTRSLILHEFDPLSISDDEYSRLPKTVLKELLTMTFKDASFSHCSVITNLISQTRTFETTLFAYDVSHGLFNYVVRLTVPMVPSSELLPSLDVRLTGQLPLDLSHTSMDSIDNEFDPIIYPSYPPLTLLQESNYLMPLPFVPSYLPIAGGSQSPHTQRIMHAQHLDRDLRGFVSTHKMGPQGKRAVWIERKRSKPSREVQIWTRDPPQSYNKGLNGLLGPVVKEIQRCVVYSDDLRDEVICCAFSEVTGIIVWGHRSGVSILDLSS